MCIRDSIYSDEILFAAKIHPARLANSLTATEWSRLAAAMPQQLAYFIEKNQMTPEEYLETKGQYYRNTPFLQVYGCEGKPCSICGELLSLIQISFVAVPVSNNVWLIFTTVLLDIIKRSFVIRILVQRGSNGCLLYTSSLQVYRQLFSSLSVTVS